jgi:membrane associated rhomboid family serine protease
MNDMNTWSGSVMTLGLRAATFWYGRAVIRLLWDFRHTIFVVMAVFGVCALVQTAMTLGMVTRNELVASRSNLLGPVTAVFTHWDWSLLSANAVVLGFFVGLFVLSNYPQSRAERVRRGFWYAVIVFPVAAAVNVLIVLRSPGEALGASGLVFAGLGVAYVLFLFNVAEEVSRLGEPHRQDSGQPNGLWARVRSSAGFAVNGSCLVSFSYLLVFDQSVLFGLGDPTVNAFAHSLGFALGSLATLVSKLFLSKPSK